MGAKLLWDVFCRVIDNHGDLGVCWRLAADLAERGHRVRLWVDDAAALRWMAPAGAPGVTVLPWRGPLPHEHPGDVVIEAFGCDPPAPFVQSMHRQPGCVWINLEYLSAEPYVARCHGLASPQHAGPGAGLKKWFFYPGFTPATGGLLREPQLHARQAGFDRAAFLAAMGLAADERPLVSLFAYPQAAVRPLLQRLLPIKARVLACPGPAQAAALACIGDFPGLSVHPLPWLAQSNYDHLLQACDLNFVRGEDSFVRAQWAGAPFVWQIYPQHDGVHADKLDAFLALHLAGADTALATGIRALFLAWNSLGPWPDMLPPLTQWREHVQRWRSALWAQPDLTQSLESFVAGKR